MDDQEHFVSVIVCLDRSMMASALSIGPDGIDAVGLTIFNGMPMDGTGAVVGQVEDARPGKDVLDGGFDGPMDSSRDVVPAGLFNKNISNSTIANLFTFDHAEQVASVIIGKI